MAAAGGVLVPLQCEFFALEGLSQSPRLIEQVRLNPHPGPGHLRRRADDVLIRGTISRIQVIRDVRQFLGAKVFETVIPRNVRVWEAPSVMASRCCSMTSNVPESQAYLKLASEMIQRERLLLAA